MLTKSLPLFDCTARSPPCAVPIYSFCTYVARRPFAAFFPRLRANRAGQPFCSTSFYTRPPLSAPLCLCQSPALPPGLCAVT